MDGQRTVCGISGSQRVEVVIEGYWFVVSRGWKEGKLRLSGRFCGQTRACPFVYVFNISLLQLCLAPVSLFTAECGWWIGSGRVFSIHPHKGIFLWVGCRLLTATSLRNTLVCLCTLDISSTDTYNLSGFKLYSVNSLGSSRLLFLNCNSKEADG